MTALDADAAEPSGGATGFRTHAVTAGAALISVLALALVWSLQWGPAARARRVAEVMSGQSHPQRNAADRVLDYFFKGMGMDGPAEQQQWATLELGRLARKHPGALARAAGGTTPDVRFAFLDVIDTTAAYASLPVEVRLEHAAVHVVRRLDTEGARPFTPAQEAALREAPDEALRILRNALVAGHCGALAGYDVLGQQPRPADVGQAAEALARAAAQPLHADVSESNIDRCRDLVAQRGAPITEGGFHVVP